jgi:soluble lytic murein transglycosylase
MFRTTVATLFLLTTVMGSASAASLYPLADPKLEAAADRLRQKDYHAALQQARDGQDGGVRDLITGDAAFRLEQFDEALPALTAAAARFPLLADYALLRKGQILAKLGNHGEALTAAQTIMKEHPESILLREAHFLAAESLFSLGQMSAARDACRSFVEKYPTGSDSLKASYLAAQALVRMGEPARGAAELRTIWLSNPGVSLADDVDKTLKELPPDVRSPFTPEELFRRSLALYDARKFSEAVQQMESLLEGPVSPEFAGRLWLKIGQAQFRLRRFADADKSFNKIDGSSQRKEQQEELDYWRARLLEKMGKNTEAYSSFIRLAMEAPASPYADNALFESAVTMKSLGKTAEAGQLFSRLVQTYPDSTFQTRAAWEAGWERLAAGDPKSATGYFQKLAADPKTSEQGLFWLARAFEGAGDAEQAAEVRGRLLRDYPYGYYALVASRTAAEPPLPSIPPLDLAVELPMPQGMERIKAFITFGLAAEARQELSRLKGKGGAGKSRMDRSIARLYLELGDYAAAMRLFQKSGSKGNADGGPSWSITHPVPFRDVVARHAAQSRLRQDLVYAVMRAESSFSPSVVSPAGAVGLMQLMPTTAKMMQPRSPLKNVTNQLTIPDYNIFLGTRHLRDLLDQYKGDEVLAVAAYNAGAGNVNRWVKTIGTDDREAFIEQIPFAETRAYVKKVLAGAAIYRGLYGKGLFTPIAPQPTPPSPTAPAPPTDEPENMEEAHPAHPTRTAPVSQS